MCLLPANTREASHSGLLDRIDLLSHSSSMNRGWKESEVGGVCPFLVNRRSNFAPKFVRLLFSARNMSAIGRVVCDERLFVNG